MMVLTLVRVVVKALPPCAGCNSRFVVWPAALEAGLRVCRPSTASLPAAVKSPVSSVPKATPGVQ